MKVFILALDGLEHTLVEGWRMRNLLQKTHGTYSVEEFEQVKNLSTSVWASFITGEYHYFDNWWTKRWLYRIAKKFIRDEVSLWKIAKLFRPKLIDKTALKSESIFDLVPNSVAVNVPVYNEKTEYHIEKLDALHFGGIEEYINAIWSVHWKRIKDVLEKVFSNWNLFMAWFDVADLIGHLQIKNKEKMRRLYDALEVLAAFLKNTVPSECVFLVVSDHGIKENTDGSFGEHTKTGFWSLNTESDWRPRRVIDFSPKILEWVKG